MRAPSPRPRRSSRTQSVCTNPVPPKVHPCMPATISPPASRTKIASQRPSSSTPLAAALNSWRRAFSSATSSRRGSASMRRASLVLARAVLVAKDVAEPDLIAQAVAVPGLSHVVATGRREQVGRAHRRHVARVVHRHLEALHRGEERLGAAAEPSRGALRALGEEVADAPAGGDHLDELHDAVRVVEAEGDAARVLQREEPLLEALHLPRDRGAERDRVHPEVVAHLVRLADGDQVVEPEVHAEGGERLVLGAAVARVHAVAAERIDADLRAAFVDGLRRLAGGLLSLLDVDDLLAADGARVAGAHPYAHLIAHRDRVHLGDGVRGAQPAVDAGHPAPEALALHGGSLDVLVEGA